MLFNSLDFLIFFPLVVLVYFLIPDRWKHIWLLLASYYFYMSWNAKYGLLLLFSTLVTYVCARLMERAASRQSGAGRKKSFLLIAILLNLALLVYFKYFNFLLSSLEAGLALLHVRTRMPQFDILLPVGISFFTFQALGYTIDVYRGDIRAEHDFLRYALFVSFFPQLVAGPIERSGNLLRQLAEPQRFSYERTKEGLLLMLWGYFLKIVLADRLAFFIDRVYADIGAYNGWYFALATMLFAVQIYCDFYGYSVIATGAARILGIRLMENFKAPFYSTSVAEFWGRWHISLTSWFRDYLYIPLGGSRRGKARKYLNVMTVFLISGLWHGANFTYVIWGGLNGAYQVIGDFLMPLRRKLAERLHLKWDSVLARTVHGVGTFILVDIAFVFFRSASLQDAVAVIRRLLSPGSASVLITDLLNGASPRAAVTECAFVVVCLLLLGYADAMKRRGIALRQVIMAKPSWMQSVFFVAAVCGILLFGVWGPGYSEASFIYFQF